MVGGTAIRCSAGAPAGEGTEWAGQISFSAGQSSGLATLPSNYTAGRWYRVRVQLFPDGRCGVALDGQPSGSAGVPSRRTGRSGVVLDGNSVGARMLFGPVEVWQGVMDGVDWTEVKPNGARAAAVGHDRSSANRRLSP